MANYVCSICGTKATSKCVKQRNIFIDHESPEHFYIDYNVTLFNNRIEINITEDIIDVVSYLSDIVDGIKKYPQVLCKQHNWQNVGDLPCMFGCCKKEGQ